MGLRALRLRAANGDPYAEVFARRAACMADLMLRSLPALDPGPVREVEVVGAAADGPVQVRGDLAQVERAWESAAWARSEDRAQRALAVGLVAAALDAVGAALGWPEGVGRLAEQRVISRGYRNTQRWRKPCPGPGRRAAQLAWSFEPEHIELRVDLFGPRGQALPPLVVCRVEPDLEVLAPLLGRLRWAGPQELVLEPRDGGPPRRLHVPG